MCPSPVPSPRRWGGESDQPRAARISSGVRDEKLQPALVTASSPPQRLGEGTGEGAGLFANGLIDNAIF